jgi:hypothetical protein
MKFLFLVLLAGVRLIFVCFRILVPLFVPLMVVKVIAHLPHSLSSRSLVLHRHLCQPRIHVELYVVRIKNIFVVVSYSDVFIALNTLIIIARHWFLFCLFDGSELIGDPVCPFFGIVDWFLLGFWLLSRFWGRGLGTHFNEVRREEAKAIRLLD